MADPVVHLTNGVPDTGTGNITTLGAVVAALPVGLGAGGGLKVDGSGTALPVSGTVAISGTVPVSIATAPVLVAGTAIIGKVGIDQTTDGTTNKVRAILHDGTTAALVKAGSSGAAATTDPALVVTLRDVNANGSAVSANSAPVVIASDQAAIKMLPSITATASGATASRVNAAASTNATSLKASAGQLYTIDVFNVAAYNVFLKLYNKASAPTVGSDTPVMTIPIQAGGGYSKTWPTGFPFGTGIAYAITKLQADSDTTVVAAGDLTGNTTWI